MANACFLAWNDSIPLSPVDPKNEPASCAPFENLAPAETVPAPSRKPPNFTSGFAAALRRLDNIDAILLPSATAAFVASRACKALPPATKALDNPNASIAAVAP